MEKALVNDIYRTAYLYNTVGDEVSIYSIIINAYDTDNMCF